MPKPYAMLESISSMIYAGIFLMKFRREKLQSCVLGLKFFGAKILYEKCAQNVDEIESWFLHLGLHQTLYYSNVKDVINDFN